MSKFAFVIALAILAVVPAAFAQSAQVYMTEPSFSPDRKEIAFVSGGDIWSVPADGGIARLLVSHPATESKPLFSPDGRYLAFGSNRTGNGDIYVLELETGALRRLTFDDVAEQLDSWSRDGKWIYFTSSSRDISGMNDIYRVAASGVLPQVVKDDSSSPPNGGSSVYRSADNEVGADRVIHFEHNETTGTFDKAHRVNETNWVFSADGPKFDDFISAYSESFPNHYIVVAKARLEIFFAGNPDKNQDWSANANSVVYLNGPNTGNAMFDITVDNLCSSRTAGSVTSGRSVSTSSNQPLNVTDLYIETVSYPEQ